MNEVLMNEVLMNTATYIKEVNNTPVLFNIDNARDMANLEALQAIKMPENMANEIFGNNIRYADNTTCVITENSGNAEFPFNVQFDSSKILAMPQTERKLTDSYLAGLGMPNLDKKIFIQFSLITNKKVDYSAAYTAPANGWVTVYGQVANIASKAYALVFAQSGDIRMTSASGTADVVCTATIPVSKGRGVYLKTQSCWSVGAYFFYAQGES